MSRNVYSVGQVNSYISNMFASDFMLHQISIKGEVSNCKYHYSGHIYFTVKDEEGAINAVMWSSYKKGLTFDMKDGDKVIVTGSVEVYKKTGAYQIYAKQIELEGAGNLYLRFEALKKELEEMGMFAPEYKRPIPKYAKVVGVVTASTGAAIQDIRNISSRRNPYVQTILYPAQVQGDGAAESIVRGIKALEEYGVDIIIVGRGGGSIEDLWAFNEELVARAIFDCSIPIISAVGHETDWTIADFVADLRAPTPSAAAELAVFDYMQFNQKLSGYRTKFNQLISARLEYARERLAHQQTKLNFLSPANKLNENRRRLGDLEEKLTGTMTLLLKDRRNKLSLLAERLDGLSPAKKMSLGYAYVEGTDGKAVKSIKNLKEKDDISVYLLDGKIKAKVWEVEDNA